MNPAQPFDATPSHSIIAISAARALPQFALRICPCQCLLEAVVTSDVWRRSVLTQNKRFPAAIGTSFPQPVGNTRSSLTRAVFPRPGVAELDRATGLDGRAVVWSLAHRTTGCGALKMLSHLKRMSGPSLQATFYFSSSAVQRILKVGGARRVHADKHEAAVGYDCRC